jgi:nucleoid-associated protein YgaU
MFLTAYAVYGDASRWSDIAEANPDVDPVFVPPGTVLRIPTRTTGAPP